MLVPPARRFYAASLDDAVSFFDARAHISQFVSSFVTSVPRVGPDVFDPDVLPSLVLEQGDAEAEPT